MTEHSFNFVLKYRIDSENEIHEINIDRNMTIADFLQKIKTPDNFHHCEFHGRAIEADDLISNHIKRSNQVLILSTNAADLDLQEQDFGRDSQNRSDIPFGDYIENHDRKLNGMKYTFYVYTTATADSFYDGVKMTFFLNDDYSTIYSKIHEHVENLIAKHDFTFFIFLPGGVPFRSGELLDFYCFEDSLKISHDYLYVVVTTTCSESFDFDQLIDEPFNCILENAYSPFCQSTSESLTKIGAFLGYIFHGGPRSEHILLILAKITRFAPLVVNLYNLMRKKPIKVFNLLAITSPLFTLFRSMLPTNIGNEHVFEYTLHFLSIFELIDSDDYLDFQDYESQYTSEWRYFERENNQTNENQNELITIWTADTINGDFKSRRIKPDFQKIKTIFSTINTFIPAAPLSLHYLFHPSFCRGSDNNIMLFLKEVNGSATFIDPQGQTITKTFNDLAHMINHEQDTNELSLLDANQIDQINFICCDKSASMLLTTDGTIDLRSLPNPDTRSLLAEHFLEEFIKQSDSFRISSLYEMIDFNAVVQVRQQLSILPPSLSTTHNKGKDHSTNLFNAIKKAQNEILQFAFENGQCKYPKAIFRIIVITDGAETSQLHPVKLINELIENRIIVDTILISTQNKICQAISRLTGGISFMVNDKKQINQIMEQEAFLNITTRHMTKLPYLKITDDIFTKEINEDSNFDNNVPNQITISSNTKIPLTTAENMASKLDKWKNIPLRIKRALIELNCIAQNPDNSYIVFPSSATPEEWRIFIKGPDGTAFANQWLSLFLRIPFDYPFVPPDIRFVTIPFHPNVTVEGKILFNLIDNDYDHSLGIDSIITGIIKILHTPDRNHIINQDAYNILINHRDEFERRNSKIGVDHFSSFLDFSTKDFNTALGTTSSQYFRSQIRSLIYNGGRSETEFNHILDLNEYTLREELMPNIRLAENRSGCKYTAKIYSKSEVDFIREVEIMSKFKHIALLPMNGYFYDTENNSGIVIMDYISNNLRQYLQQNGNLDKTAKLIIMIGIASAMEYLAKHHCTHGDLKSENILINDKGHPKIIDFDSIRIQNQQGFISSQSEIYTPCCSPPELNLIENRNNPNGSIDFEKVDVYAFGFILYEILTNINPFIDESRQPITDDNSTYISQSRPTIPDHINVNYKQLIKKCWDEIPQNRPTFTEIISELRTMEIYEGIDRERLGKYLHDLKNYACINQPSQVSQSNQTTILPNERDLKKMSIHFPDMIKLQNNYEPGPHQIDPVYTIRDKNNIRETCLAISYNYILNDQWRLILHEINILKRLKFPTLLTFKGYNALGFGKNKNPTIIAGPFLTSFDSSVTTLKGILKQERLNGTAIQCLIYGIAAGMKYLHDMNILHRDLKPSNILIDSNKHPMIIGFGLARFIKDKRTRGKARYLAPELWEDGEYTKKSDVYAFGILLLEILFPDKCNSFFPKRHEDIKNKILNGERPLPNTIFELLRHRNVGKELIMKCLEQKPVNRPDFGEITDILDSKFKLKDADQQQYKNYIEKLKKGNSDEQSINNSNASQI